MPRSLRGVLAVLSCTLLAPLAASAAGVGVLSDFDNPVRSLFPSDVFTVKDLTQNTGRRVRLPKPSCADRPSDCADIDVINTLDGFNLQPRLSVAFDGPIDVSTVSSQTVFLVSLGSTLPGGPFPLHVVGIDQVVWDPATLTLHVESDELLDQHTRYAFFVTGGVHDLDGDPVTATEGFLRLQHDASFAARHEELKDYGMDVRAVLRQVRRASLDRHPIVAISLFTTQSATSTLEKVRAQIKGATPEPADFLLGAGGSRTVFPLSTLSGIAFNRQIGTNQFVTVPVPVAALAVIPGAVGTVAFGRFASPDYEAPGRFFPPIGTRTGTPAVQGTNDVFFTLFLPAGAPPPNGWPVAIFGHGFGDNRNNSPYVVGASMAAQGIATVAINVVGHGGGPAGTLTVVRTDGAPVSLSAGGRGIDQNGDGLIDATEGSSAAPPRGIIGSRDGLRQTVIDLMQLVREIEVGVDVDGDAHADLDAARIYYFGQSFGGIYGTKFLAVEPSVAAGVPNVGGGSIIEISRLGGFRPLVTAALAARVPSLLNLPGGFNENIPLRDQPAVVNTVAGAMAIQEVLDRTEWVSQAGNPVAYAPHLRKSPLHGVPPKSVIFQFAKGDQTVPNPTTTAILRAGALADRATYFRNDLAFAADPAVPKNPHTFLTRITTPSVAAVAFGAQRQIATFFASDGMTIIDPDGPGVLFEVPIVGPLPEDLSFIP
jgi:virulence factor lipase-like protein